MQANGTVKIDKREERHGLGAPCPPTGTGDRLGGWEPACVADDAPKGAGSTGELLREMGPSLKEIFAGRGHDRASGYAMTAEVSQTASTKKPIVGSAILMFSTGTRDQSGGIMTGNSGTGRRERRRSGDRPSAAPSPFAMTAGIAAPRQVTVAAVAGGTGPVYCEVGILRIPTESGRGRTS